jgi:hypothetical protein
MAGKISMSARREVLAAVSDRYLTATRREKGRILDELCATTGWHRKHAMRALSAKGSAPAEARTARRRGCKYDAIRDALTALWEASDRVCGKRLVAMIPMLLPSLERHGRVSRTCDEAREKELAAKLKMMGCRLQHPKVGGNLNLKGIGAWIKKS